MKTRRALAGALILCTISGPLAAALPGVDGAERAVQQVGDDLTRGRELMGEGRFEEALTHFRRAAAEDPRSARAHDLVGQALYELGRFQEAVPAYRRAVELEPEDAGMLDHLGEALYELGRHQEALAALDRAVAADPARFHAHLHRGQVLRALGRDAYDLRKQAQRDACLAMATNPRDRDRTAVLFITMASWDITFMGTFYSAWPYMLLVFDESHLYGGKSQWAQVYIYIVYI